MFLGTMHFVKCLMLVGERALSRCSSTAPVCLPASVLVHQRRILFWLKMVRSDNVILHTLAGCSRDSVVALLWAPAQRKRATMLYFANVLFIYFFLWPPYSPAMVNGGPRKFYTW